MHILFLTWKDIKHPSKGGAEIVLYNYMIRLIEKGHKITWLGSGFKGGKEEENIDGIRIIRKFNIYSIYFLAWSWYLRFLSKEKVDLIIDEAGGIPLMSPFFVWKIPIIFFIHHIGDKEWDYKLPFPLNKIFKYIFGLVLKLYNNKKTITVSNSTAEDLLNYGYKKVNITVIENVLDIEPVDEIDFEKKEDWIVFVGRLMPVKRVEDAIESFYEFHSGFPGYRLKIIGNNQDKVYVQKLKDLTVKYGIDNIVDFLGQVSPEEKNEIVSKSKACLIPSMKEGFGLVVLESNAMGTAVLGYNVAGLKDTINDGINGHLIDDGNHKSMGEKLKHLIFEQKELEYLSKKSLEHVKNLPGWDEQTNKLEKIINLVISK